MTPFRYEKTFSEWRVCDVRSEGKSRAYLFFFLFFRREINRNDIKKKEIGLTSQKGMYSKMHSEGIYYKKKKKL